MPRQRLFGEAGNRDLHEIVTRRLRLAADLVLRILALSNFLWAGTGRMLSRALTWKASYCRLRRGGGRTRIKQRLNDSKRIMRKTEETVNIKCK